MGHAKGVPCHVSRVPFTSLTEVIILLALGTITSQVLKRVGATITSLTSPIVIGCLGFATGSTSTRLTHSIAASVSRLTDFVRPVVTCDV